MENIIKSQIGNITTYRSQELYFNGWNETNTTKTLKKIAVNYSAPEIELDIYDKEYITEILINKLSRKLFNENLVNISDEMNYYDKSKTFTAEINVAPLSQQYHAHEEENFIVDGEYFSEDDLINAVKIAYPERFI